MYPDLVVFDLDACFWDQEMYTLNEIPTRAVTGDLNGHGEGTVGVMSGPHEIRLHSGALQACQDHWNGKFTTENSNTKFLFASSADTPFAEKIGRQALKMLEVVPGVTVWDLVVHRDWGGQDYNQIGRQPPLSSNKSTSHFPILQKLTNIEYDRMLFFDDCQWGNHCLMVSQNCKSPSTNLGPVVLETPYGLRVQEWEEGLRLYAKRYQAEITKK